MAESRPGYTLLASAINHPDQIHPLWGVFNHRSLDALVRSGTDVTAVVPRPHAPPIGPYSQYRSIPRTDSRFLYPVAHPRFLYYLPKSLLYHRTGDSIASTLTSWYDANGDTADIVHGCHLYPDGYGLSRLAASQDIPLTTYAHGTIVNDFETFNAPTRRRIAQTLTTADCVFCSATAIETKIHTIAEDVTTEVVPIGATPSNFPTDRREAIRQELKIPADATVVLFCGHLTAQKGVDDILGVLPDLDADLYFVFIGHGGDLRADVQTALGEDTTPPGQLCWQLDPVAVRRWFAVANLLVLPSYSEGRPTVIYEAMASQTPVLATDVGGISEQVADGTTGWIIEPGDTASLRTKLQELSTEPLRQMGRAAENRLVEAGWTWESHADAIGDTHATQLDER
jgi:glycosyltransferase involved in cell wall biosynthesis